ncbi:biotin--[acetyl-CoA-carboxylase] ligase [Fructilactobacillus sanfranciscensis]|uniref:Biotin--[acetyl-CoA-carboxylase] ligase n=1 Tax=Fructilactobacillus sanfranciscensis TaxID=1625 RepID=A0A5C4TJ07_FRUSA|nr:biotin--[acetyl-CoA-carboxylase] ligase [Fructilactobacillus sanfranciscensis]POH13568.1 biotin--[acetyl-CoA-carboxylase] ligase [Fructilactobacillus sanfranciscensis]TNK90027.1 biotin--[acetyl-CoA-carboxylase] ligase [Fructilactobacillus sanfranciscensis]TNK95188.1 biotin--[acetyl-CoA-carboxylase] ligase [Fructilactobacillus sanfranciscensis]TNK98956.1 biotin--[acetyl-CoA-carboxylase] ligase [Fructilactobacillus sanfranciscensis]TNL00560.1 biotin--[acetyl-CoA-carboxylase] ligase [Fructilac
MKISENKLLDLIQQPLTKLVVFDKIDSTMNYAQANAWSGHNLVMAESQTAGKGQHGHAFASPATGIYETIIVPAKTEFIKQPGMLTLGVGVCVRQAIKDVLDVETRLKWVNDIYYRQKKCGGILVETKSDSYNQIQNFVIGIGLNLMSNEQLKQVGAVSLVNDDNLKNELIAKIYDLVIKMVCQPDSKIIIREYQKYLIWKNQLVSILVNDNKIVGKITGISDDFQLRLVDEKKQVYLLTTEESQHLRIK